MTQRRPAAAILGNLHSTEHTAFQCLWLFVDTAFRVCVKYTPVWITPILMSMKSSCGKSEETAIVADSKIKGLSVH